MLKMRTEGQKGKEQFGVLEHWELVSLAKTASPWGCLPPPVGFGMVAYMVCFGVDSLHGGMEDSVACHGHSSVS